MKPVNLCYLIKGDKVLLIEKKRGFGEGNLNAPGGKIEQSETPKSAAIREVKEEVGIIVNDLEFMGIIDFINNNQLVYPCYIFISKDFEGDAVETDEARPFWIDIDKIPYERMWEDDVFWLPSVLEGKKILGRFWFKNWKLIKHKVWELKRIFV